MMDRMREVRTALEQSVIDPDWKDWVDGNTSEVKRKAERVHDIIHRQSWWRLVEEITDLMR